MATVVRITYARVAADATPKAATSRDHDANLDKFLLEHVKELEGFAQGKNSCPATFFEAEGEDLFEELRSGDEKSFLDAAHKLTVRLIGQMNGSTSPGLLVCMQIKDGASASAAVLKLQVVAPNAANLETLDSGEVLLSSVTNVMDAPGKLQKGAIYPDARPNSDVIMGDVASKEAQYFPRAFGISIEQRADHAAVDTLEVIRELHGDRVEQAARVALPTVSTGPIAQVLESLSQSVPELEPVAAREAVLTRLADRPRPVRQVNTAVPLTEVITASDIIIKVPVTGSDRVTWEPDNINGGYVITIRVEDPPRREIRR